MVIEGFGCRHSTSISIFDQQMPSTYQILGWTHPAPSVNDTEQSFTCGQVAWGANLHATMLNPSTLKNIEVKFI
jgi:hypothetical protein